MCKNIASLPCPRNPAETSFAMHDAPAWQWVGKVVPTPFCLTETGNFRTETPLVRSYLSKLFLRNAPSMRRSRDSGGGCRACEAEVGGVLFVYMSRLATHVVRMHHLSHHYAGVTFPTIAPLYSRFWDWVSHRVQSGGPIQSEGRKRRPESSSMLYGSVGE